jgi:hypothetical protein
MEAEALLVDRLKDNVNDIAPRDLPGAIRNVAVGSAVHTEKAQLLNDQPTERRAVDLAGTLAELKSLGVEPKHVLDLQPESEEEIDSPESQDLGSSSESQAHSPGGLQDSPASGS